MVAVAHEPRTDESFFNDLRLKTLWIDQSVQYTDLPDKVFTTSYEFLVSDDDGTNRDVTKHCYHVKWEQSLQPFTFWDSTSNRISEASRMLQVIKPGQIPLNSNIPGGEQPDPDALMRDAAEDFLSDFSLPNFLLELDDIPEIFRRASYRSASSTALTFNLGVLPLIGDLSEIFDRVRSFGSNYERFADQLQSRGVRKTAKSYRTLEGEHPADGGHAFPCRVRWQAQRLDVWGLRIFGRISQSPLAREARRLGLSMDLGTVWNALPMSFVIDYFVPLGETLSRRNLFPNLWLGDQWHSSKLTVSWTVEHYLARRYWEFDPVLNRWVVKTAEPSWTASESGQCTIYQRSPLQWGFPDGIVTRARNGLLSRRQMTNLLALTREFSRPLGTLTPLRRRDHLRRFFRRL